MCVCVLLRDVDDAPSAVATLMEGFMAVSRAQVHVVAMTFGVKVQIMVMCEYGCN